MVIHNALSLLGFNIPILVIYTSIQYNNVALLGARPSSVILPISFFILSTFSSSFYFTSSCCNHLSCFPIPCSPHVPPSPAPTSGSPLPLFSSFLVLLKHVLLIFHLQGFCSSFSN